MDFSLQKNGTIEFRNIDGFLAAFLMVPFQTKDLGQGVIAKNFYQKLQEKNSEFSTDWREYIEPELLSLFSSSHQIVLSDLDRMDQEQRLCPNDFFTLKIPLTHREAWLRMLSMVRLSLTAEHRLDHEKMEEETTPSLETALGRAEIQMQLFAVVQQCLIEAEEERLNEK